MADQTDEELVVDATEGDAGAFETLMRRHSGPLLSFCRRLLQDAAAAEDALQEAFIRAHAGLRRFDTSQRFASWVFKIAQNTCMDLLRARRAWEPLPEQEAAPAAPPLRTDRIDALERAEASLPGKFRAILHYKYRLGLDAAEIAERLGLTHEDVRVSLHRALKLLRERVSHEASGR